MVDAEILKSQIHAAFEDVEYPGDWCLRGSNEGTEPFLLEQEFAGKSDWRLLTPEFLDQAPDGYGSALSFFSDEAFRFYLPAYLIAEIDERLGRSDPTFHLTYGLSDSDKQKPVNRRRYGARTWFEEKSHQLATLDGKQASAVVAYLRYKRQQDDFYREAIDQALANFWLERASG